MIIEFKLKGNVCRIRRDSFAYMPLDKNDRIKAYHQQLGSSINWHIRQIVGDEEREDEVISLRDYVKEYNAIKEDILGISLEDIHEAVVTPRPEDLRKTRKSKKEPEQDQETEVEPEETDEDWL